MGIGMKEKLENKIQDLFKDIWFYSYGQMINISQNGKEFVITAISTKKILKEVKELIDGSLVKFSLDEYLIMPDKLKRRFFTPSYTPFWYYECKVKKEYQSLFKKLKKEYQYKQ
jgi:hypothetical protein